MISLAALEPYLATILFLTGALLSAGSALWIARFGDRERPDRNALIAACAAMVVWCAASATLQAGHVAIDLALTARNIALVMLIFRLFAADGRDARIFNPFKHFLRGSTVRQESRVQRAIVMSHL